jgi:uncharacterized protein YndB with AHSA1/START domain
MEKFHLTTHIKAPREKVWKAMLENATYREWTKAFHPNSDYRGDWTEGSKILFVGPDENGKEGGMVSMIAKNVPYEFISIKHIGVLQDGKEITSGDAVKNWAGAFENYTFTDKDGGTELSIDMDISPTDKAFMAEAWPKALAKLKEIAEKE